MGDQPSELGNSKEVEAVAAADGNDLKKDKLIYFDFRARAEAIRMMYALAGAELEFEIMSFLQWPRRRRGDVSYC